MHEVSIALNVLDIAIDNCRKSGYDRIESIRLKIGRAAGIMPDALVFAFDAVKTDTLAEKATIIIDHAPVGGSCNTCKKNFVSEETYVLCCPECGSNSFRINSGRELEIIDMEVV